MTKTKKALLIIILALIIPVVAVLVSVDVWAINSIDETSFVAINDVKEINKNNVYGKGVRVSLEKDELAVGEDKYKSGKLIFKLFGFLPIKTVSVFIVSDEQLYLGGIPLGFSINTDGVIVCGTNSVNTANGLVNNFENIDVNKGDIIKKINGESVAKTDEVVKKVNSVSGDGKVNLEIKRGEKTKTLSASTAVDADSGQRKLGVWIRDNATGIGTLTYVKADDNSFGALGHSISDNETGAKIDVGSGSVYACSVLGIEKGDNGEPGALKGVFITTKTPKGSIASGNKFGIFGTIEDSNGLVDTNKTAYIGSRLSVKTGKAKLVSSVSGIREEYDIEIIKASKQSSAKDKSMIIRIVDKRLLDMTGGIVQGMSGSPILQNGKIVGALTHVFVSDSTKGYAIYLDWMLLN